MSAFLPILKKFEDQNVSYMIVGGLAVVLHGWARLTTDIDLIIALDKQNCERAIKALISIGYRPRVPVNPMDFADARIRQSWIDEKGLTVMSFFSDSNPLVGIDLFVECPDDYDKMFDRAVYKALGEVSVRVASIDDLIMLKRISSRPKDLEDIKALEEIRNDK